jgi:hypothetical protein
MELRTIPQIEDSDLSINLYLLKPDGMDKRNKRTH